MQRRGKSAGTAQPVAPSGGVEETNRAIVADTFTCTDPAVKVNQVGAAPQQHVLAVVQRFAGLRVFGFVFAVNSSVHSYLILAFGDARRITRDFGFYYMANAAGRLLGTLLSGVSFQAGGLPLCLATSGAMAALSWRAASGLRRM